MKNRGSDWSKWDLHIHTPKTLCSNYGGDTQVIWDKFIDELERLSQDKDLKVIGINDYLFIDGYKKVLEYKKSGRLANIELILPVVEFRLKEFVGSKELGRLNYHIIFADSSILSPDQIETQFLSGLRGKGNLDPDTPDYCTWGGVITRESLVDLGNHIINNTPVEKRGSMKPIDIGFNNINFELSKIEDILGEAAEPNIFLKKNYFKAIGKAEWEDFRWDGSPFEKKNIINKTHFVFSASPTIAKANEGRNSLISNNVNSRLLHCSDAHGFAHNINNTKPKEIGHCFTWIKALPTFEGLKQIIFEPEHRVIIQASKPDFKEDKVIIDKIKFLSPNKTFTDKDIYLNPNLNVIVGGKSSGKSILLYSIAKTLLPDQEILLNELDNEKYNLSLLDSQFNFQVTSKSGISQLMFRDTGENSIIPDIKYIPQNYLVKLAEPELNRKGKPLNKLVRDLISEDSESKSKYDFFIKNVKHMDKEREDLINLYFSLNDDKNKLETELKTKSSKTVLETNIKTNTEKVEELNKQAGLNAEELKKYKDLQVEQAQNLQKTQIFKNDFELTKSALDEIKQLIGKISILSTDFVNGLQSVSIKTYYSEKLNKINDLKNDLNSLVSEINIDTKIDGKRYFTCENKHKEELTSLDNDRKKILEKLKPYQQNQELQLQIRTINESISSDKRLLNEIEKLTKNIFDKNTAITKCKLDIFNLYDQTFQKYNEIIAELKDRTIELEKEGLKIEGVAQFNFAKIYKNIYEISDGRKGHFNQFKNVFDEEKKATTPFNYALIKKELEIVFNLIVEGTYAILPRIDKKHAIKVLLEDYFFDYWKITYQNDKLGEMSTGKASFVILMLIIGLSKSKSPILIDQPEDNLDNRSITRNLVQYLKNKKLERQIIVVTHNANIVVNSDAENIIVANQRGQNDRESESEFLFDYINGAIENSYNFIEEEKDLLKSMGIREHVADIVEGGKIAFKKREEKYGF